MDFEKMLKALGEPTRLAIYKSLLERKHCVRSLSKKLGITGQRLCARRLSFLHPITGQPMTVTSRL